MKQKISAFLLETFSIGLIQLSPASLMSSNDNTLTGGWMLAEYCLGGAETSLVTFLKIPVPQMNMYSRDLLNYTLYYDNGRDLFCCVLQLLLLDTQLTSRFHPGPTLLGWGVKYLSDWRAGCGSHKTGVLPTQPADPKTLDSQLLCYWGKHCLTPRHFHQRNWMRMCATIALHSFRQKLRKE